MATFNVEEYCSRLTCRNELFRLQKEQLAAIALHYEVNISPEVPEAVQLIGDRLNLPDPEKEEAARQKKEAVRFEREEKKEAARLKEEEANRQLEEKKIELERERLRAKEKEMELKAEQARLALEREKLIVQNPNLRSASENGFDPISCLRLIPKFNITEVGVFFEAFERIANEMKWPRETWTLLIQGSLEGRAQEAYAALDATQSKNYEVVKQNVLAAYELVPEAYRLQFRSLKRKSDDESFLELAKRQELLFGRWLTSSGTTTFEGLCALVLMEQFKKCVPQPIKIHLNEQGEKDLRKAATLADQYELTHHSMSDNGRSFRHDAEGERDSGAAGGNAAVFKKFFDRPQRFQFKSHLNSLPSESKRFERPQNKLICHFCKKPGHKKSVCPKLLARENREASKPVACVAVQPQVQDSTGFIDCAEEQVLKDYKGFVSQGTVSMSEEGQEVPVTVLRDSGAAHSLLLKGVLELSPSTATGLSVVVKGVGDHYVPTPKHRCFVKTQLVTRAAAVGVIDTLPMKGISFLLGNDLAGTRVRPSDPEDALAEVVQTHIVQEQPCEEPQMAALEKKYTEVFTACVSRSGLHSQERLDAQIEEPPVDLSDTSLGQLAGMEEVNQFTREALVKAQCEEPSIAAP